MCHEGRTGGKNLFSFFYFLFFFLKQSGKGSCKATSTVHYDSEQQGTAGET